MIGIYNRFCRKCNENNCKQRKKRAFFLLERHHLQHSQLTLRHAPFFTECRNSRMPRGSGTDATAPDGGRKIQQPHSSRVQPIFSVVPVWSAACPFFAIVSHKEKTIPSAMHFLHMRSASECAASHRWSGQCLRCGPVWRSDRD